MEGANEKWNKYEMFSSGMFMYIIVWQISAYDYVYQQNGNDFMLLKLLSTPNLIIVIFYIKVQHEIIRLT